MFRSSRSFVLLSCAVLLAALFTIAPARAERLGNHAAVRDARGQLLPWTTWEDALAREVRWYAACPPEHGYPRFVTMTFMDGSYQADPHRDDLIPATQDGMGILSYLGYWDFTGRRDAHLLATARAMGDFLVEQCSTPDSGAWPRFTRSTGRAGQFPLPPDCGSQGDQPFEVQPDKGAIAGYALVLLHRATGDPRYLDQALRNARALASNMRPGDGTHSPWPFRVDWRSGAPRGDVSSDMVYVLRLFDALAFSGHGEFAPQRESLWTWIRERQLPNLAGDGLLWVQFFEDHHGTDNRNAWAPLNLARYLLERRDTLDALWAAHAHDLVEFVNQRFVSVRHGVAVCGEQDYDRNPWGGALSTYGAVLAMYGAATGSDEYRLVARQALDFALYATDDDGCPGEQAQYACRGGWQEDAHTDKLHNYVDAMRACPGWGRTRGRPAR
jgi:hypothetical protein